MSIDVKQQAFPHFNEEEFNCALDGHITLLIKKLKK